MVIFRVLGDVISMTALQPLLPVSRLRNALDEQRLTGISLVSRDWIIWGRF